MALQTSGQISLNDIHVEVGGTTGTEVSLNDSDVRDLINKADGSQNAISEYYGAASEVDLSDFVTTQINGQDQLHQITVSNYVSSGGTLIIPSNVWVWTNSTSVAAMTVDVPCTIVNNGKVIGCGGRGGGTAGNPVAGGPAINVTSSGVTITNASGAYIAGGGGGGGLGGSGGSQGSGTTGGGGGAGGGAGGDGTSSSGNGGGSGGVLNASGGNGSYSNPFTGGGDPFVYSGYGGGAGGGGGGTLRRSEWADGGGGGRILPGTGGARGTAGAQSGIRGNGGAGGSGGSAGSNTQNSCDSDGCGRGAAGGGGWGASGGNGQQGAPYGAAGGAAITGTSRTLSNSGTIYGST
jgi:hypothetical protein